MKRTALLNITLALACISSAFAFDYGALITNDSKLTGNKPKEAVLEQNDTASAWLRIPFNNAGTSYFAAEGLYQFRRVNINVQDVDNVPDAEDESFFDVSLAKFATSIASGESTTRLSIGRFATADTSSLIYNQTADGILAAYDSPVWSVSAYGAYTGLLNTRKVSLLNENGFTEEEDVEKKYDLAKKYAVGALMLAAPNFWNNQTVSVQALGALRLEDDRFNRLYATLALNGPLTTKLFYALSSTVGYTDIADETKSKDANGDSITGITNLSKLSVTCYTGIKSLALTANGVYASGMQGPFKPFLGITSQTAVKALSGRTEYTGLIRGGLSASVKPARTLLLNAGADAVFDAQTTSIKYEGFQWQGGFNLQLASDVSMGASAYQYIDDKNENRNKCSLSLLAAIAL